MKKIVFIILLSLFIGCAPKEEVEIKSKEGKETLKDIAHPKQLLPKSKAEIKEIKPIFYTYHSYGRRDPFVPLIKERYTLRKEEIKPKKEEKKKVSKIDIKNISLMGIISDERESLALLTDNKENGYILRNGLLYDDKGNKVKGIEGTIKEDYVILKQGKSSFKIALGITKEKKREK